MRARLLVAYHGANFHGWQIQTSARSVEGALTAAASRLNGRPTKVWGASRTDAGVHAQGQVAAFDADRHDAPTLFKALNSLLPDDIGVICVEPVDPSFHPRHSARGKRYRYDIWNELRRDPFIADRSYHVRQRLDVDAMRRAAAWFVGEQDFASLQAVGCEANGTVRILWAVDVTEPVPGLIRIEVAGSAFLRYMVRTLVGTLLEVGTGRRPPEWVADVLAARDRRLAGPTAEARGLTLLAVRYPDFPWLQNEPHVRTVEAFAALEGL